MITPALFDKDYYERGVETRVSGYQQYHWRPEYVMEMANWLRGRYGTCTTLDYGCAKGYLVKAMRLLGMQAFGFDISEYAIQNADPAVKNWVSNEMDLGERFDLVVSKDTLEHVPYVDIDETLSRIATVASKDVVVIVPLGDSGLYRIREYELDATHQIREDEAWWVVKLRGAGLKVNEFHYSMHGFKDHWTRAFPYGNGIFIASK